MDILKARLLGAPDGGIGQDPLLAMAAMIGQAMDFMAEYPSFARLWVSENWRTSIFGACFVVGLDRQTYHPERTRDQSVAAIMVIKRGYVIQQPAPQG